MFDGRIERRRESEDWSGFRREVWEWVRVWPPNPKGYPNQSLLSETALSPS